MTDSRQSWICTGRRGLPAALALTVASLVCVSSTTQAASGRAVALCGSHTCALTAAGGVKCWGYNGSGQLGDGSRTSSTRPVDVAGLTSEVTEVAAGYYHSCALTTSGGVKCWGANWSGRLGDGTTTSRTLPVDVVGLASGASSVAAGHDHTCALTSAGGVKCWGSNTYGQLGDGTTTSRTAPVDVVGLTSGVAAVAPGYYHTCALTTGGGVRCWGSNSQGQLGDGTVVDRLAPVDVTGLSAGVVAVAAGASHTCAVTTTGQVKCWGRASSGQLGDGTTTPHTTPVDVVGLTSAVVAVAAGDSHTCALAAGGGVKCWGASWSGQRGDGTTSASALPVDVAGLASAAEALGAGFGHTCAVTSGGGVKCWGDNTYGQLGNGASTTCVTPADVTGLASGVGAAAAGNEHTCALTTGGGVKCWGENGLGQLGDGTTTFRVEPVGVTGLGGGVVSLAAGHSHACALTTGGGVKCWGENNSGELGDGTTTQARLTPVDVTGLTSGVAAVEAGSAFSCAVTTTGQVKCWGWNSYGQLGDGTTTATRVTPVDVLGLTNGVAVAPGSYHTCALTTGGGVKCWGDNASGQLGDGTTASRATPADVTGLTTGVAAVGAGYQHTCALTTGGGVKCWGNNTNGELGDGTSARRATPVDVLGLAGGAVALSVGGHHACVLTGGGGVRCWGANWRGPLGDGTTTNRATAVDVTGLTSGVVAIAAGDEHTCAVTSGGGLKCWGDGSTGQVGHPAYRPRWTPVRARGFGSLDFDDDAKVDLAVYRPGAGTWFSLDSSTANATYRWRGWGLQAHSDTPVVGDFDGDGVVDPTVYRPASGTWFVLESHAQHTTWRWFGWGNATDTPVPADYDGDGATDAAVYRSSTGQWFVLPSSTAFTVGRAPITFGDPARGDVPVAGDFDGDGAADIAVYRPPTGTWFVLTSSSSFTSSWFRGWGLQAQGDTPAPGDYDGDGKTDPCVFRPATGTWFVLESHANHTTWSWFGWGDVTDTLVPADYDADGRTDGAVYRPATREWFVRPSGGASPWQVTFGQPGDLPLIAR